MVVVVVEVEQLGWMFLASEEGDVEQHGHLVVVVVVWVEPPPG